MKWKLNRFLCAYKWIFNAPNETNTHTHFRGLDFASLLLLLFVVSDFASFQETEHSKSQWMVRVFSCNFLLSPLLCVCHLLCIVVFVMHTETIMATNWTFPTQANVFNTECLWQNCYRTVSHLIFFFNFDGLLLSLVSLSYSRTASVNRSVHRFESKWIQIEPFSSFSFSLNFRGCSCAHFTLLMCFFSMRIFVVVVAYAVLLCSLGKM